MWGLRLDTWTRNDTFHISFFSQQQNKYEPGSISTPAIDSAIQHQTRLRDRVIGEIAVKLSPNRERGKISYTEAFILPSGNGVARLLQLRAAVALRKAYPQLQEIEMNGEIIPLKGLIQYLRVQIAKDRYRARSASKHDLARRRKTRRRIHAYLGHK